MQNNYLNKGEPNHFNDDFHSREPIHQYFEETDKLSPSKLLKVKAKQSGYIPIYTHQKYDKFCPKLQLLQLNLNRLYGQHQTIKPLIQNSKQIQKELTKLNNLESIKKNIEQLRIQYVIAKSKNEVKRHVFLIEIKQRLQIFSKQVQELKKKYSNIVQCAKKYKDNQIQEIKQKQKNSKLEMEVNIKQQYAHKFIEGVQAAIQKYYKDASKHQIDKCFQQMKQNNIQKINLILCKVGELQCRTEYSKYLKNSTLFESKAKYLQASKLTVQQKLFQIGQLELNVFISERQQILGQNKQRIKYQIFLIQKQMETLPNRQSIMDISKFTIFKNALHERITTIKYQMRGLKEYEINSYKKMKMLMRKLQISQNQKIIKQHLQHLDEFQELQQILSKLQHFVLNQA